MAKAIYEKNTLTMAVFCYEGVWLRRSGENKTLARSLNGVDWVSVYTFPKNIHSAIITENGTYIVSIDDNVWEGTGGELWRSDDDGVTFTKVHDMDVGTAIYWSFATKGNTILAGEYAQYPSPKLWISRDDGLTWSVAFENPSVVGNVHVHNVAIDPADENNMLVGYGDTVAARGVWYSTDNGVVWSKVSDLQITSCEYLGEYIYLFTDNGTGNIYRDLKSNFENNTLSLQKVFDAVANNARSQVYASTQDELGRLYAGYVDENNLSYNDPGVLISADGLTWERFYRIPKTIGTSRGVYYLSRPKDGIIFAASSLDPVKITYFEEKSTLTIRTS